MQPSQTYVNLGILAHVDAGKTTLTERLLFGAGLIASPGSVQRGTTQTDSLALERQRGITIRSAVVSFRVGEVVVNLIDTPGHCDFIAEVERVLDVLDGAVLVVSAVEGVQAQTRVLVGALRRLSIPMLFFVNKIDRRGADPRRVTREIDNLVDTPVIALGEVRDAGRPEATSAAYRPGSALLRDRLVEVLSRSDDDVLEAAVTAKPIEDQRLRHELVTQTRACLVQPLLYGSAMTGAGAAALASHIGELLAPDPASCSGGASGSVFKVERTADGEKLAYLRLFEGTLAVRDRVELPSTAPARITALDLSVDGGFAPVDSVVAGQIARVHGLAAVRVGDRIGPARGPSRTWFSPPSLEAVVDPVRPQDRGALYAALTRLAEQDPLINVRQDDVRGEISVSLYGEVQKEVLAAMLADDFGVQVSFRETSTICIERVTGHGSCVEVIATGTNPYLATVGLRVHPAAPGSGIGFELAVELGSMPPAFFTATQQAVSDTLRQGLYGWRIPDCVVTMTHAGYWARQSHMHGAFDLSMSSTAGDFRKLTPLVLMAALRQAGTAVHEPVHRFDLEVLSDTLSATLALLSRHRGVAYQTQLRGEQCLLTGQLPAATVHRMRQALPAVTRGEGALVTDFEEYQRVHGPAPRRARVGVDPLDRREYLLRVTR